MSLLLLKWQKDRLEKRLLKIEKIAQASFESTKKTKEYLRERIDEIDNSRNSDLMPKWHKKNLEKQLARTEKDERDRLETEKKDRKNLEEKLTKLEEAEKEKFNLIKKELKQKIGEIESEKIQHPKSERLKARLERKLARITNAETASLQRAKSNRAKIKEQRGALEKVKREEKKALALREQEKQEEIQWQKNILRILSAGKIPQITFVVNDQPPPFKFQKSEHPIWMFSDTEYLEQKTRREIVGRSAGASVRVARGLWVRVGQSRGTPVEYEHLVSRGVGLFAITTKHVYFHGDGRSFRISFNKIVSMTQMEDGVSVTRDRVSAQPEFFLVGEKNAAFAFKLLQAIPSFEESAGTEIASVRDYHLIHSNDSEILEEHFN